ncbi:MAG: NAD(P)-binding protein, partial [Okeania sp. SIO2D1]|nr:NAD(P)-binding protein [Okeania sp. SIO2D1]
MVLLKLVIIGGGIGGLTLARACLDRGLEVEVYEKRSLPEMLSGPGGIFIQRNAMHVYKLLWDRQISDRLYQQGGIIREGGFFSKTGELLYFNSPQFVQADDLGVCLLRPELQQILYESLPAGTVKTGHAFKDFEESSNTIQAFFENGSKTQG